MRRNGIDMNAKQLTNEEKLKLVMARNSWSNDSLDGRLYSYVTSDGPIGLRTEEDHENSSPVRPSVTYPSAQILANTWNPAMAAEMGAGIANDCIDNDVDIILGPAVNIKRLPVCGRNFEYYSEDPVLAGLMAESYIEAVQSRHIGTCIKHYCCNNAEGARLFASSDVDERTMREIYLKQFEIAMKAKPWTVMSSYNYVNGVAMSNNKKMFDILRNDLGFDGLVMSDWNAVKDSCASVNGGLDIEMPYDARHAEKLKKDFENGKVDIKMLDRAAQKVIDLAEKCEAEKKLRKSDLTVDEREQIAIDIAREGMVLLKNDGILPIKTTDKFLVTGAPTRNMYSGGGSANVTPRKPFTSLQNALRAIGYEADYRETFRQQVGHQGMLGGSDISAKDELTKLGKTVALIGVGNNHTCETEAFDRDMIKLTPNEVKTIKYLRRFTDNIVVIVYAGSAIDMDDWIDDVSAVLFAGYCGSDTNKVVAEILAGKTNPSGKLSETFPVHLEDVKAMSSYSDLDTYSYTECLDVGYRYFVTHDVPVMFPFGYGLSYSEFEYSGLKLKDCGSKITASFDIENKSDTDGMETAQLYIAGISDEEGRPAYELKGFEKKLIPAKSKVSYTIEVDKELISYFSLKSEKWEKTKGKITVMIGRNACDIELFGEMSI